MDMGVLGKLQNMEGVLLELGSFPLGAGGTSHPEAIQTVSESGHPASVTEEVTLGLPGHQ